jgi:hypothetical protein
VELSHSMGAGFPGLHKGDQSCRTVRNTQLPASLSRAWRSRFSSLLRALPAQAMCLRRPTTRRRHVLPTTRHRDAHIGRRPVVWSNARSHMGDGSATGIAIERKGRLGCSALGAALISGFTDEPITHSRDREARDKADNAYEQHLMGIRVGRREASSPAYAGAPGWAASNSASHRRCAAPLLTMWTARFNGGCATSSALLVSIEVRSVDPVFQGAQHFSGSKPCRAVLCVKGLQ